MYMVAQRSMEISISLTFGTYERAALHVTWLNNLINYYRLGPVGDQTVVGGSYKWPLYPLSSNGPSTPTLKINKNNNVLFLFMLPFDLRVCWSEQAVTWPHDSDRILSSFYIISPSRSTRAMIPSGYYHTLALPFVPIWSHGSLFR